MPFIPPFGTPPADLTTRATIALDNLASVAINTSLISDTDATDTLGTTNIAWNAIYSVNYFLQSGGIEYMNIVRSGDNVKIGTFRDLIIQPEGGDFHPNSDSLTRLGKSSRFWDQTFTDELVLSNVGAAAAATNTVRVSAIDLSAGNTMLDIDLEGTGAIFNSTDNTVTDKLAIGINGTTYYIMLTTSNA